MRYRWLPTWEEVPKHLHENALLSHYEELEVSFEQLPRRICNIFLEKNAKRSVRKDPPGTNVILPGFEVE